VGIIWLRWSVELRARWRALVVTALLLGIGGGVALGALAGARRTDTAMAGFVSYSLPDDSGFIYGSTSGPTAPPGRAAYSLAPYGAVRQIVSLPQVKAWFEAPYLFMATDPSGSDVGNLNPSGFSTTEVLRDVDRPLVVAGHLPDPSRPFDVAVNEFAADKRHLHVGSRFRVYAYSYSQIAGAAIITQGVSKRRPEGPSFTVTVTAVVRFPTDVSAVLPLAAKQDVTYEGEQNMYMTPAFLERLAAGLGIPVQKLPDINFYGVRLRHGSADWKAFASEAAAIGHGQVFTSGGDTLGIQTAAASAQRGIHLEVVALVLFGILALFITLLFVGQAVARQVVLEADDYAILRTLGVTRAQLVWIVVMRAAVLGLAGAAIALSVAVLSSPLLPVGLARQAEIHPGFAFDAAVLVPGAFALAALVSAGALIPAWSATRRSAVSGDPGGLGVPGIWASGALGRVAVPTTAAIGVRYGLEPGRGRSAVPVVSALVASVLGVAALAASLTVGSSLSNLISSPRQQGWNWDVLVGNPNDLHDEEAKDGALLAKNPYVASYSAISILAGASQGTSSIDGHLVNLLLAFDPLKGYAYPPVIAGHAPRADDQIVLASDTLLKLHTRIGRWVTVDGDNGKIRLRVVGEMVSPSIGDLFTNGVGEGGWVYGPAVRKYAQAHAQSQPSSVPPTVFNIFAVRYKQGVSRAAAFASLQRSFGRTVLNQLPAEDVVNLHSVDHLPLLLAGLMALLGVMTLGNTLVISVRRRRKDFAILRAIGFVRPQVIAVVAWQATSFALLALLVGLPVGIAGGRLAWSAIASGIGSASPGIVPLAVALIVPGTLVAANAISAWPGWGAARIHPASVIRSE
jgi:MacB-like periplasmic core domain/FtsX-like permease family